MNILSLWNYFVRVGIHVSVVHATGYYRSEMAVMWFVHTQRGPQRGLLERGRQRGPQMGVLQVLTLWSKCLTMAVFAER